MATDKNAQRLSCLKTGCTTREPEEEEEGVTEGKREGVSRHRGKMWIKGGRGGGGGSRRKEGEEVMGGQSAEEPRKEKQVGDEHCRRGREMEWVRQSERERSDCVSMFSARLSGDVIG